MPRPFPLLTLSGLAALAAVAFALFTQHAWNMQPCAWCVFQRLLFLVFALLALAGGALRSRLLAGAAALTALGGLAAAVWQQTVASKSTSCAFTFADKAIMNLGLDESLPAVFKATASCAEASAPLAGLPYTVWSGALFVLLAAVAARALRVR